MKISNDFRNISNLKDNRKQRIIEISSNKKSNKKDFNNTTVESIWTIDKNPSSSKISKKSKQYSVESEYPSSSKKKSKQYSVKSEYPQNNFLNVDSESISIDMPYSINKKLDFNEFKKNDIIELSDDARNLLVSEEKFEIQNQPNYFVSSDFSILNYTDKKLKNDIIELSAEASKFINNQNVEIERKPSIKEREFKYDSIDEDEVDIEIKKQPKKQVQETKLPVELLENTKNNIEVKNRQLKKVNSAPELIDRSVQCADSYLSTMKQPKQYRQSSSDVKQLKRQVQETERSIKLLENTIAKNQNTLVNLQIKQFNQLYNFYTWYHWFDSFKNIMCRF